mgnify:CR=1 FL=1
MNNLIKVQTNENNEQVVSGRDLHEFLEVKTKYVDWIERKIQKYGFIENRDFVLVSQKWETNNPRNPYTEVQDHIMKLSMAKEVSMTENNEKGRQARLYFIQCEEAWNSPEMVLSRANQLSNRMIEDYTKRISSLEFTIQQQSPKVLFADAVATSDTSILIGDLAKLLKQNGIDTGQRRLFEHLRTNGYLMKQGSSYNMPTQRAMEMGLFEVKERTIANPDGSMRLTRTTKVTGKGQQYFINLFLGNRMN